MTVSEKDEQLIEEAKKIIKKFYKKYFHTVGSAIRTKNDEIITGIHTETTIGNCTVCGEVAAISKAVSSGEEKFDSIVSVAYDGKKFKILPPCGRCRELISEFGDVKVILESNGKIMRKSIKDLLPIRYQGRVL